MPRTDQIPMDGEKNKRQLGQLRMIMGSLEEVVKRHKCLQKEILEILGPLLRDEDQPRPNDKKEQKLVPVAEELNTLVSELERIAEEYDSLVQRIEL